jgi:hypothetical protein
MKIVLGILISVAIGIIANLVSNIVAPAAERNRKIGHGSF